MNTNANHSAVFFSISNEKLADAIGTMAKLSSISITSNDTAKANQLITVCYKQTRNDFPAFNSGPFSLQYENHFLNMLENIYSFHSDWIKEKVTAYKIVIKDKARLDVAITASTHGSYSSTNDPVKKTLTFVNQQLQSIAATAEDYLGVPFFADEATAGYDFELTLSSLSAFEVSLANYGLTLKKTEGYEIKKLRMTFYQL